MPCHRIPVFFFHSRPLFLFQNYNMRFHYHLQRIVFHLVSKGAVKSHLLCFCQETWSPAHSSALQHTQQHMKTNGFRCRRDSGRGGEVITCRLTLTPPSDL